ncbi:hypothetical protein INT47_012928 [Mucor saturninus]|uniref:RING-type domain-containing protein n=1 Tax=Mucor saturninus TaxID=64648 RepID=A0A8H7QN64_9FUNG|nr:hypothetical protein INT47_012928 [Mucor saturninus]
MSDTEPNVDGSNKKQKVENTQSHDQEEEHITCMICSDVWRTKGSHCQSLITMASCIIRWITERTEKLGAKKTFCPMCMKIARLSDIRIVTPVKIAVKDATQIDLFKKELETKKYTISNYQKSLESARLTLIIRQRELIRAQSILDEDELPPPSSLPLPDQS